MVRGAENKTNSKFHTGDRTDQAHSQLAECWPAATSKAVRQTHRATYSTMSGLQWH